MHFKKQQKTTVLLTVQHCLTTSSQNLSTFPKPLHRSQTFQSLMLHMTTCTVVLGVYLHPLHSITRTSQTAKYSTVSHHIRRQAMHLSRCFSLIMSKHVLYRTVFAHISICIIQLIIDQYHNIEKSITSTVNDQHEQEYIIKTIHTYLSLLVLHPLSALSL